MNPELVRKAFEKVGNANTLTNLISRRVRQLNSVNRPMMLVPPTMGAADIALSEIVDGKMSWEVPEPPTTVEAPAKKRRRH